MDDRRAFASLIGPSGSRPLNYRIRAQLIAHDLAEGTSAFAMDDSDPGHPREIGIVDVRFEDGSDFLGAMTTEIDFEIDVRSGRGNKPL
jgi:hypothetical protein